MPQTLRLLADRILLWHSLLFLFLLHTMDSPSDPPSIPLLDSRPKPSLDDHMPPSKRVKSIENHHPDSPIFSLPAEPTSLPTLTDDQSSCDSLLDDSTDESYEESEMVEQIPSEKRGQNFQSYLDLQRSHGKSWMDILLDLGFKHLANRLDSDEDAFKVIEKAIEASKDAIENQLKIKNKQSISIHSINKDSNDEMIIDHHSNEQKRDSSQSPKTLELNITDSSSTPSSHNSIPIISISSTTYKSTTNHLETEQRQIKESENGKENADSSISTQASTSDSNNIKTSKFNYEDLFDEDEEDDDDYDPALELLNGTGENDGIEYIGAPSSNQSAKDQSKERKDDYVNEGHDHDSGNLSDGLSELDENDLEELELLTDPVEILAVFSSELRRNEDFLHDPRMKLDRINGEVDAIEEIRKAQRIVVLSGAGISVACGVPDFRSPGGLYDQIKEKYDLADPQMLFDIHYLRQNQVPFYDFAAQLFPSTQLIPSKAHRFIKKLQDEGKLLRNYTQNIDTLEQQVGISSQNLVLCHGSFATFSCPKGHQVDGSLVKPKLDSKYIPQCEICADPDGKMFLKPDIVFFGEPLPDTFSSQVIDDIKNADLLIVMGSSLRVQPVALVPRLLGDEKPETPQILFNRELVAQPHQFDHAFLSDIDPAVERVCEALGWEL